MNRRYFPIAALVLATAVAVSIWALQKPHAPQTTSRHAVQGTVQPEAFEVWRLGDNDEADQEIFGFVCDVGVDNDGNIYLVDSQRSRVTVHTQTGEYLRSIGSEGEGPGEFRNPSGVFIVGDTVGVAQAVPGRIALFSRSGASLGDIALSSVYDGRFVSVLGVRAAANVVVLHGVETTVDGAARIYRTFLDQLSFEGPIARPVVDVTRSFRFSDASLDEGNVSALESSSRWCLFPDGGLAVADDWEYSICVYNQAGDLERTITRAAAPRHRGKDEIERLYHSYEGGTGVPTNIVMRDIDHAIRWIGARSDGTLWVLTSHAAHEVVSGTIGTFDVFSRTGEFVRRVTVPGNGDPLDDCYYLLGDRLLLVTQVESTMMRGITRFSDDDEPMQVICYQLR